MKGCSKLQLLLILVFLSACSDSKDVDENITQPPQEKGYEIITFDITGTSADIGGNKAPINSGINNGAFDISWYLSEARSTYTTRLFFSSDSTLSSDDTEFYVDHCQAGPQGFALCEAVIGRTAHCTFDNENEILCDYELQYAADLTNKLPTLPYDGFIIIESCEFLSTVECDTPIAHAVQLQ